MKSKRTKAREIKPKVREAVEERDRHMCVFCGSPNARGEAHIVRRSQGGLGIEQNILCVCRHCHHELDEGKNRELYMKVAITHMKEHYPDWNMSDLIFKKGYEYD